MTCQNCNCQPEAAKKKPAVKVVAPEPRRFVRLNYSHLRDFVVAALVAVGIYFVVAPTCDCKALTARIEQLEQHDAKADSQFHKSLK
jgi:hypothetical protein